MKRIIAVFVISLAASLPLAAQEPQGQGQQIQPGQSGQGQQGQQGQGRQGQPTPAAPQQGGQPRPGGTPPPTQPATTMPPRPEAATSWQNISLAVTITDSGTPEPKKSVGMLLLDGRSGQIRSTGANGGVINIDASPTLRPDGRIYLHFSLEYQADAPSAVNSPRLAFLNESLSLMLVEGKSTLVSQSADPRTDRKVTVEVTANVVK